MELIFLVFPRLGLLIPFESSGEGRKEEGRQTNFERQLCLRFALCQRVHYGDVKIEDDFVGKLRGKSICGDEVVQCID